MDFALDETQQVIARVTAELAESALIQSRPGLASAKAPSSWPDSAAPERLWKALGRSGMLALAVPTAQGGEGLGAMEIGIVLRELGRRAALTPAFPHLVSQLFLARHSDHSFDPESLLTLALRGYVPYADTAHRILIPVHGGVAVVDPARASLTRTYSSSGAPEFCVEDFEAESVVPGSFARMAGICAAALGDGLLAGALDLTTAHVASRHQFGRPLATFQAVAQQIADVYIASRTLHLAALAAAWTQSESDVDTATVWLASEGLSALRTCHHLHGGIGLDLSYPLHRYTSMMKDLVRHVPGAD